MGNSITTAATNPRLLGGRPPAGSVWLWNVLQVPADLRDAAAVRISDRDARTELGKLKATLSRQAAGSSIGEALASLGPNVTEESPEGERDRDAAGLLPVRLSDLDARAANQLLAYVGVIHGVLVCLIPSSAIKSDLPPHLGDRIGSPRNGATELLLEAINSLAALEKLAVPRLDRVVRDIGFQGLIFRALRDREVILWDQSGLRDLRDQGQLLVASVEGTSRGDGDAISRKQNVLGGRLSTLTPPENGYSGRDFNYKSCPLGYAAKMRNDPGGARVPVKGSIQINLMAADGIRKLWESYASGAKRIEIGQALADLRVPLRDGSGRTFADLSPLRRIPAVSTLVTAELAALHRTGTWEQTRTTDAPIPRAGGIVLERRSDGRRGTTVLGKLPVPIIDGHPWGISPDTWKRVEERLAKEAAATAADHGARRQSHLLSKTNPVWADGVGRRLVKEHGSLQLREQRDRGDQTWQEGACQLRASCPYDLAMRALGSGLAAALAEAALGDVDLACTATAASTVARDLAERCSLLQQEVQEHTDEAEAAGDLARLALNGGQKHAASKHLAAEDLALGKLDAAKERLRQLEADLERERERPGLETADLSTPLGVAGALMRWNSPGDPDLHAAVQSLQLLVSLQGSYEESRDIIRMHTTAVIPLTDGRPAVLTVKFDVPNSARAETRADRRNSSFVRAWCDGTPLSTVADSHGTSTEVVRRGLRSWLAAHNIRTMATALLDCPILATRQAVIAQLDATLQTAPEGVTAATVRVLVAPYLDDAGGSWKCWTGYEHATDQRLMQALALAGGTLDIAPLAQAAGADPQHLRRVGGRPALVTSPSTAVRQLRPCPHEDCEGQWASHVLYVPETAAFACICPDCGRFPDTALADVRLPVGYLQYWERQVDEDGLQTRAGTADELLLPDADVLDEAADLVRVGEVQGILGLTPSGFGSLRARGALPPPIIISGVEMWRRPKMVEFAADRAAAKASGRNDGLMSPKQAAQRLAVPEHRVRQYCEEGRLGYTTASSGDRRDLRLLPAVVAAFRPPLGDRLDAVTLSTAADRLGIPLVVVRRAADAGDLPTVRTSGGALRVLPDALAAWQAQRPRAIRRVSDASEPPGIEVDTRLSVSAAAAVLGLSPKQVRRLADKGVLNDHRQTTSSWRWFDPLEVHEFAQQLLALAPANRG